MTPEAVPPTSPPSPSEAGEGPGPAPAGGAAHEPLPSPADSARRAGRRRGALAAIFLVLVCALAFLLASTPARNSDLWLHLASGRCAGPRQAPRRRRPLRLHHRGRLLGQPLLADRSGPVWDVSARRWPGAGRRQGGPRGGAGGAVLLFPAAGGHPGAGWPSPRAAAVVALGPWLVAPAGLAVAARRGADPLPARTPARGRRRRGPAGRRALAAGAAVRPVGQPRRLVRPRPRPGRAVRRWRGPGRAPAPAVPAARGAARAGAADPRRAGGLPAHPVPLPHFRLARAAGAVAQPSRC